MRPEEIKKFLERRPFVPFRLLLTSGERVEVRHPETVLVARSHIAVALRPRNGIAEYVVWYSLIHIVKVSPLSRTRRRPRTA